MSVHVLVGQDVRRGRASRHLSYLSAASNSPPTLSHLSLSPVSPTRDSPPLWHLHDVESPRSQEEKRDLKALWNVLERSRRTSTSSPRVPFCSNQFARYTTPRHYCRATDISFDHGTIAFSCTYTHHPIRCHSSFEQSAGEHRRPQHHRFESPP